jgi:hypothetical protein
VRADLLRAAGRRQELNDSFVTGARIEDGPGALLAMKGYMNLGSCILIYLITVTYYLVLKLKNSPYRRDAPRIFALKGCDN